MSDFVKLVLRNNNVERLDQLYPRRLVKLYRELEFDLLTMRPTGELILFFQDWLDIKHILIEKGIKYET